MFYQPSGLPSQQIYSSPIGYPRSFPSPTRQNPHFGGAQYPVFNHQVSPQIQMLQPSSSVNLLQSPDNYNNRLGISKFSSPNNKMTSTFSNFHQHLTPRSPIPNHYTNEKSPYSKQGFLQESTQTNKKENNIVQQVKFSGNPRNNHQITNNRGEVQDHRFSAQTPNQHVNDQKSKNAQYDVRTQKSQYNSNQMQTDNMASSRPFVSNVQNIKESNISSNQIQTNYPANFYNPSPTASSSFYNNKSGVGSVPEDTNLISIYKSNLNSRQQSPCQPFLNVYENSRSLNNSLFGTPNVGKEQNKVELSFNSNIYQLASNRDQSSENNQFVRDPNLNQRYLEAIQRTQNLLQQKNQEVTQVRQINTTSKTQQQPNHTSNSRFLNVQSNYPELDQNLNQYTQTAQTPFQQQLNRTTNYIQQQQQQQSQQKQLQQPYPVPQQPSPPQISSKTHPINSTQTASTNQVIKQNQKQILKTKEEVKQNYVGRLDTQQANYYYEGGFNLKGERHGQGKFYNKKKFLIYTGGWVDDQYQGWGSLFNEDPQYINGDFEYTDFDKIQAFWQHFEGEFDGNTMHGRGTLTLTNKEQFCGQYRDGFAHGVGRYKKRNGEIINGIWENNQLKEIIS